MKKMSLSTRIIAVLVFACMLTTIVISGTYAKYASTVTGTGTATVAKWQVAFKEGENMLSEDFTFKLVDTTNGSTSGTIAPMSKGSFALAIDATGAEVAIDYSISLDVEELQKYLPIKFYSDAEYTAQWGTSRIGSIAIGGKSSTTVYWQWVTNSDEEDTIIGKGGTLDPANQKWDYTFGVTMTASQKIDNTTTFVNSLEELKGLAVGSNAILGCDIVSTDAIVLDKAINLDLNSYSIKAPTFSMEDATSTGSYTLKNGAIVASTTTAGMGINVSCPLATISLSNINFATANEDVTIVVSANPTASLHIRDNVNLLTAPYNINNIIPLVVAGNTKVVIESSANKELALELKSGAIGVTIDNQSSSLPTELKIAVVDTTVENLTITNALGSKPIVVKVPHGYDKNISTISSGLAGSNGSIEVTIPSSNTEDAELIDYNKVEEKTKFPTNVTVETALKATLTSETACTFEFNGKAIGATNSGNDYTLTFTEDNHLQLGKNEVVVVYSDDKKIGVILNYSGVTVTPSSITEDIKNCVSGSTLILEEGTYTKQIVIPLGKTIVLVGQGKDKTIIKPDTGVNAILVNNGCKLTTKNLTIALTGTGQGIVSALASNALSNAVINVTDTRITFKNGRAIFFGADTNTANNKVIVSNSEILWSNTNDWAKPDWTNSNGADSDTGNRAINIYNSLQSSLEVDNSTITSGHYVLNLNSKGLTTTVKNSYLQGYSALNIWNGDNSTITVEKSTLMGHNRFLGGTNDYGTIVLYPITKGSTLTLNIIDTLVTNDSLKNREYLFDIRSTGVTVNIKGNSVIRNTTPYIRAYIYNASSDTIINIDPSVKWEGI